MKKFFLLALLAVLSNMKANARLGIDDWNWWLSSLVSTQGYMPYYFCSDFGKVKGGFNACIVTVYEASVKFGELTPESKPFIRFDILLNDKGKILWYEKESWESTDDGYVNSYYCEQCFLSYDETTGKLLSETYTTKPKQSGDEPEIRRKVVYKYDTSNRLVMIDCYKGSSNTIEWKTKFVYGNGYVDRYEYYSTGYLRCQTRDTKDVKGRFWKYTTKEQNNYGQRTMTETVTYNEKGVVAKIDGRYSEVVNGKSTTSTLVRKYDYNYDSNGNWTDRVMSWKGHFLGDEYEWVHCEYYNK